MSTSMPANPWARFAAAKRIKAPVLREGVNSLLVDSRMGLCRKRDKIRRIQSGTIRVSRQNAIPAIESGVRYGITNAGSPSRG
ncbi:MAG: hypothetical protein P8Z41_15290 [Anaerolineales bacterium]